MVLDEQNIPPTIVKKATDAMLKKILSLLTITLLPLPLQGETWNTNASGNWGTSGNWTPTSVPNGTNDTATLGNIISAARTITLNNNYKIGTLNVNSAQNYTINRTSGGNRNLTFNVSSGNASINIQNTSDFSILGNARVVLNDTVNITHLGSGLFTLGTQVSGTGGINHSGSGITLLSQTNTYTGTTNITGGTLAISNPNALGGTGAGTVVSGTGSLGLQGTITSNANEALTISGSASNGALQNIANNNTWEGNITLAGSSSIKNNAAGTLLTLGKTDFTSWINTAGNTLTIGGEGNLFLNSAITGGNGMVTGPGNLVKTGSGTAVLYADENWFTGYVSVEEGTLDLDTITNRNGAIKGTSVFIGDGTGAAGSAVLANGQTTTIADEMINDSATLTFKSDGKYSINDETETIGVLDFTGGEVSIGGGTLKINAVSPSASITSHASNSSALIDAGTGTFDMNGSRTITVADGSAPVDMEIKGNLAGGSLTKSGTGTLSLSGSVANTYSGTTTVNAGTLELAKTGGAEAVIGSSLTVNSGGTLLLKNENQIANATNLTLNGGTFATGGFNETLGALTLTANSTISLGTGIHMLHFANSSTLPWMGTLTINGWTGTYGSEGTQGQIFFGNSSSGLTASQLSAISFSGFGAGAILLSSGELVPVAVPDAPAIAAALIIVGIVIRLELTKKKRRRKLYKPHTAAGS